MGKEEEGKRGMGRQKGGAGTGREKEGSGYFCNLGSAVFIKFHHVNNFNLTAPPQHSHRTINSIINSTNNSIFTAFSQHQQHY